MEGTSAGSREDAMSTPAARFGKLLRDLRKREEMSQIKLASLLGVDDSTINKMESGSRRPPREPKFYERLREVPGFSESDITLLLEAAEYAPAWLSDLNQGKAARKKKPQPQTVDKLGVTVDFTVKAKAIDVSDEDLNLLSELLKKDVEAFVELYLKHKWGQAKLLKEETSR
jgi:transcriptional regulator with XRE-family HTH domain